MQLELLNSKWTMTKKQSNTEATMSVHILFTDATIFFWHKPLEVRFTLSIKEREEGKWFQDQQVKSNPA
jgi:hypothetical protein